MKLKLFIIATILLLGKNSFGQSADIDADRPGQTIGPYAVPVKSFQTEIGLLRQTDKGFPPFIDRYFQHPSLLAKYGLVKFVELRVITEYATISEEQGNIKNSKSGINNLQVGGKFNFVKDKGLRPAIALIAHYNFRGRRSLYKDSVDGANFRFAFRHNFSQSFSLGYNLGMAWERFGSSPAFIYTLSPKFTFAEKWQAFAEIFGYIWNDRPPNHSADGGISYFLNDQLKIDASAGFGISKLNAPDRFYAIGASFRFGN